MTRNRGIALLLFPAILTLSICTSALAAYPDRAITLVVPWSTGGGSDIIARALAKPLEKELGQPVIVSNRPGGSGSIGTSFVAHAKPDGYTIGLINNTGLIHQIHYGGVDYTKDDLTPLALVLKVPLVLAVNSKSPISNLADYVAWCKKNPGKMLLGMAAAGGGTHLPMEEFIEKADIKVQPMPFKDGGVGALTALVGNHIGSAVVHPSEIFPHIQSGALRALAVAEPERLAAYPDMPTLREQGYDVTGFVWRALLGPKGLPVEIQNRLVDALSRATQDPDYLATVNQLGDIPVFMEQEEFKAYLDADNEKLLALIKRLGMYQKNLR